MSFGDDLLDAIRRCIPIFLRLALGVTFLTAVADRFRLCGQFGTPNALGATSRASPSTRDS
jgi:hypothetical protein